MTVAGFGLRKDATVSSLRDALAQALVLAGTGALACGPLTQLATVQDKADAPGLQALAASLNLPVFAVPPEDMASVTTLTDNAPVRGRRGTGSVAEAAALAAAMTISGPRAMLVHPRVVSSDRLATCAIASATPISRNRQ